VFDDASPIYRQIADEIRQDIVTGALGPDAQVMSTNQYAAFHRINPATVAKAFQGLVDEGLLYTGGGTGLCGAGHARDRLLAERGARFVDERVAPVVAEARRLGIPTDDVVAAVRALAAEPQRSEPDLAVPHPAGPPGSAAPTGAVPT
jgi:DNA-binding transcriptional regulator YhcF (GntR family)